VHSPGSCLACTASDSRTPRRTANGNQLAFHQEPLPNASQKHLLAALLAVFASHNGTGCPSSWLLPVGRPQTRFRPYLRLEGPSRVKKKAAVHPVPSPGV